MQTRSYLFLVFHLLFLTRVYTQEITYHHDIKPILQKNCVHCHQAAEIGPMPLTTYEEVAPYGKMLQYVTSIKLMPPGYADPQYNHFANEQALSQEEINLIEAWVSSNMKEGINSMQNLTALIKKDPAIRAPDLVIPMKESFEQYGIYLEQYQAFVLSTHLKEDTWIDGIEFVPGNKKIVRSAIISVETSDKFVALDAWDPRYGFNVFGGLGLVPDQPFWYTWSLQQGATYFSEGSAKFLPKNSKLILHIQYGPTGRPLKDSSFVKLYFSKNKSNRQISTAPLINPYCLVNDSLFIPANTKKMFHASYTLPYTMEILSLTPQANLICRSWEVYAIAPGKPDPIKLLKIKDWNLNWRQTYHLTSPIVLPKGTVIHALASYDNTSDNLCNPSEQPVNIPWGPYVFNEMFFVHFEYLSEIVSGDNILLAAPTTVSQDSWPLFIDIKETGSFRFVISDAVKLTTVLDKKQLLPEGKQTIRLDISEIPNGNYLLEIFSAHDALVARSIFVKLREKGL
ncbi:MAG: hypothetical protein ABIQ02_07160 [Saprospiraceae bacterium]